MDRHEGPGELKNWSEDEDKLSNFNFLKLAVLHNRQSMMRESWPQGCDGRHARKLNARAGTKLEEMIKLCRKYTFDARELTRHSKLGRKFIEVREHTRNGRCNKWGEECRKSTTF